MAAKVSGDNVVSDRDLLLEDSAVSGRDLLVKEGMANYERYLRLYGKSAR